PVREAPARAEGAVEPTAAAGVSGAKGATGAGADPAMPIPQP
ncbi:hypothetical protein GA0115260_110541, partial [Streptomyces sp. MnatMP-M27]